MMKEDSKRKNQAKETREKLLNSARSLFAQKGYCGTSVRMINRNIDMADGLLYHYFPGGKEEILRVLVKENAKKMSLELHTDYEMYKDMELEEVMEHLYLRYHDGIHKYMDIFQILMKDGEAMKLVERDEILVILKQGNVWFPQLLRTRIEQGELREMDCECATEVMMSLMLHHLLMQSITNCEGPIADSQKRKQLIHYMVSLWRR